MDAGEQRAERTATVRSQHGLHARPAAVFVRTATGFRSQVEVEAHGKAANAKSIISVLGLGVNRGDTVVIRAVGEDALAAVQALAELAEKELE